jgi:hypothetical protein
MIIITTILCRSDIFCSIICFQTKCYTKIVTSNSVSHRFSAFYFENKVKKGKAIPVTDREGP